MKFKFDLNECIDKPAKAIGERIQQEYRDIIILWGRIEPNANVTEIFEGCEEFTRPLCDEIITENKAKHNFEIGDWSDVLKGGCWQTMLKSACTFIAIADACLVIGDYQNSLACLLSANATKFLAQGFLVQAEVAIDARRSVGKVAADARHDKPSGSRDKRAQMQALWASGKYTSRDICADEEHEALGISFSAARKALRNTPQPS